MTRSLRQARAARVACAVGLAALALAGANCPNICSGHGSCSNGVCTCYEGYTSADCSLRSCPTGRAWADVASAADTAHAADAECSNMGICNRKTGFCECHASFEGAACEKSACHGNCNGHGICMSLEDAAAEVDDRRLFTSTTYTTPWDADKLYGCVCDEGRQRNVQRRVAAARGGSRVRGCRVHWV